MGRPGCQLPADGDTPEDLGIRVDESQVGPVEAGSTNRLELRQRSASTCNHTGDDTRGTSVDACGGTAGVRALWRASW